MDESQRPGSGIMPEAGATLDEGRGAPGREPLPRGDADAPRRIREALPPPAEDAGAPGGVSGGDAADSAEGRPAMEAGVLEWPVVRRP